MALENHEYFVTVGEARLWSVCVGAGTPTLLLNGGPGCDDYLAPVADMVAARCRVTRFEPRGCGRSSWDGNYDLHTLLDDIDAVRGKHIGDKMLLMGHSQGVNVALAYAMRFPDRVFGVIGIAGGKVVDDRSWSAAYHAARETEDTGGLVFKADDGVNKQGNEDWKAYCRRPDLFRDLKMLNVKTVFINATNDIRPNWPTKQLAYLMPNAKYVEIIGAGHLLWLTHATSLEDELCQAINFVLGE